RSHPRVVKRPCYLAVWPRFPDSYWSFRGSFRGTPHRSPQSPLPLLTIAGAAPKDVDWRLHDENTHGLVTRRQLEGADALFVSGMLVQRHAILRILRLGRAAKIPTVLGGPCVTQEPHLFPDATLRVCGELEGLKDPLWEILRERDLAPRTLRAEPTP